MLYFKDIRANGYALRGPVVFIPCLLNLLEGMFV